MRVNNLVHKQPSPARYIDRKKQSKRVRGGKHKRRSGAAALTNGGLYAITFISNTCSSFRWRLDRIGWRVLLTGTLSGSWLAHLPPVTPPCLVSVSARAPSVLVPPS